MTAHCGRTPATGCLYDVRADPGEHHNLAADPAHAATFAALLARLDEAQKGVYSPDRYGTGGKSPLACQTAFAKYGDARGRPFWGPFLP